MRFASCLCLIPLTLSFALSQVAERHRPADCPPEIDVHGDHALRDVSLPPSDKCSISNKNGFLIPDPSCTPGAVNPTLTLEVMKEPNFRTGCVRDQDTQPQDKAKTYHWYGLAKPANNTGENQICELDHLISLELGGADSLDNIWPQCGPSHVALEQRFFKRSVMERYRCPTHKRASRPIGRNILRKLRRLALGETASNRDRHGWRMARRFRSARREGKCASRCRRRNRLCPNLCPPARAMN